MTRARKSKKSRKQATVKTDIFALLSKPVKVGKAGQTQLMRPYEISLRKHVTKALTSKSMSMTALRHVLKAALKYGLSKRPPEADEGGGVVIAPGRLTKEDWNALRDQPSDDDSKDK